MAFFNLKKFFRDFIPDVKISVLNQFFGYQIKILVLNQFLLFKRVNLELTF